MKNYFEWKHKVAPEEIDGLGHVNNLVYIAWFLSASASHTEACGMESAPGKTGSEGWVIRRHEIDYLAQVLPEDTVVVRTWIEQAQRATSVRRYEVINAATGRLVCSGLTVWVWINYATGRPSRIPDRIYESYGVKPGVVTEKPAA